MTLGTGNVYEVQNVFTLSTKQPELSEAVGAGTNSFMVRPNRRIRAEKIQGHQGSSSSNFGSCQSIWQHNSKRRVRSWAMEAGLDPRPVVVRPTMPNLLLDNLQTICKRSILPFRRGAGPVLVINP